MSFFILMALAVQAPLDSPQTRERASFVLSELMPIARELVDAAATGDEAVFRKYVSAEATIATKTGLTPFRSDYLRLFAQLCRVSTMSFRLLEGNDQIGIFWDCPNGLAVTRLNFSNRTVVGAESGGAVVYVAPPVSTERGRE